MDAPPDPTTDKLRNRYGPSIPDPATMAPATERVSSAGPVDRTPPDESGSTVVPDMSVSDAVQE